MERGDEHAEVKSRFQFEAQPREGD